MIVSSFATLIALGLASSSAIVSSIIGVGGNVLSLFNFMQLIELMALTDMKYSERMNQFLIGFEFTLFSFP